MTSFWLYDISIQDSTLVSTTIIPSSLFFADNLQKLPFMKSSCSTVYASEIQKSLLLTLENDNLGTLLYINNILHLTLMSLI